MEPADTETQTNVWGIIRTLLETEALKKIANGSGGYAAVSARRELLDMVVSIVIKQSRRPDSSSVTDPHHRKVHNEQFENFWEGLTILNQPSLDATAALKEVISIGVGEIQRQLGSIKDLLERGDITDLLEHGPMRERLLGEYREEKKKIVEFVYQNIFTKSIRCFLQASTTIVWLADILREHRLRPHSLIHTNSTVFPYLVLGKSSEYHVYPVGGQVHDPLCCGWLPRYGDEEAERYLRSLFDKTKRSDPLELAIVTPQFMSADGRLWFDREETKHLVDVLMESAPRVLVLSPAPRIYEDSSAIEAANKGGRIPFDTDVRRREETSIEFVIAGKLTRLSDNVRLKEMADAVHAQCHYLAG